LGITQRPSFRAFCLFLSCAIFTVFVFVVLLYAPHSSMHRATPFRCFCFRCTDTFILNSQIETVLITVKRCPESVEFELLSCFTRNISSVHPCDTRFPQDYDSKSEALARARALDARRFQIHSSMAEAPCTQNRNGKLQTKQQPNAGEGGGSVSCSTPTCMTFISRRLDCMSRSVCLLVMPHSATSSVRGDEISSTLSWNSGM